MRFNVQKCIKSERFYLFCGVNSMPEVIKKDDKRELDLEELIEGTKESLKQAKEGKTLSDEESIRERIEQYRQKS